MGQGSGPVMIYRYISLDIAMRQAIDAMAIMRIGCLMAGSCPQKQTARKKRAVGIG